MSEDNIDIFKSHLVPKHEILSPMEKEKILKELNVSIKQMPRISISDAAIKNMSPKKGDIVKIIRKSPIGGESFYYRVVKGA